MDFLQFRCLADGILAIPMPRQLGGGGAFLPPGNNCFANVEAVYRFRFPDSLGDFTIVLVAMEASLES